MWALFCRTVAAEQNSSHASGSSGKPVEVDEQKNR